MDFDLCNALKKIFFYLYKHFINNIYIKKSILKCGIKSIYVDYHFILVIIYTFVLRILVRQYL